MIEIIAFVVVVAILAYFALKATNDMAMLAQERTSSAANAHGKDDWKARNERKAREWEAKNANKHSRTIHDSDWHVRNEHSMHDDTLLTAEDIEFKHETSSKLSLLEKDVQELRKRVNTYELGGIGVDATLDDVVEEIDEIREESTYSKTQAAVELQELRDKLEDLEGQMKR